MPQRDMLSNADARALAITAQGLGAPRPQGPVTARHLRAAFAAIGTIQLDAINVLARTQYLVPFSRVGPYDVRRLDAMTGPRAEIWEYWGHAASLLPARDQPLFRWRMALGGPYAEWPTIAKRTAAWRRANAAYLAAVLQEVRDRGPMPASELSDPRRRNGEWWGRRSVGRQALEFLFASGDVSGWRAPNFERVYDVPERVLSDAVLQAPTPTAEDAQRTLLLRAAKSLGVATAGDLAHYYILNARVAKPLVTALAAEGQLVPVGVEGWRDIAVHAPGYARAARPPRPRNADLTVRLVDLGARSDPSPLRVRLQDRGVRPRAEAAVRLLRAPAVARRRARGALRPEDRQEAIAAARARRVHRTRSGPGCRRAGRSSTNCRRMATWLDLGDVRIERRGNLANVLRRVVG